MAGIDQIVFERDGRPAAVAFVDQEERSRLALKGKTVQISPYATAYVEGPLASGRADAGDNTFSGKGIRSLIGALYLAASAALFKLCRKLTKLMGSTTRRYLDVNANILRSTHNANA